MCLTDMLFNSPRLRFSEAQKRAVLSWARSLGATGLPSLYALEKIQKELNSQLGDPTTTKKTRSGKIFYINEIGSAFAKVVCSIYIQYNVDRWILGFF